MRSSPVTPPASSISIPPTIRSVSYTHLDVYKRQPQIPVYKTELDGQELARAAQVIGNARRPVIYFGGGVAASEAGE